MSFSNENSSQGVLGSHFLKGSSPHFEEFFQQHHQPAGCREKNPAFLINCLPYFIGNPEIETTLKDSEVYLCIQAELYLTTQTDGKPLFMKTVFKLKLKSYRKVFEYIFL